ncbi:MAG: hypothetical protein ACOYEV_18510 [Candidatus Nanopelagicales bacterium]
MIYLFVEDGPGCYFPYVPYVHRRPVGNPQPRVGCHRLVENGITVDPGALQSGAEIKRLA